MAVLLRTQSDERLVALARAGHERAFEVIVQRYRGLLLRSARRYLSDGRAEDAVQQAFLAAWSALQRGDEVRDLRPWLYRIVHNTALNALRAAGYDYAELPEGLAMSVDEVERREDARDALSGLAALPERQREALLRVAVEGRPQGEVARELGVSEGAVRQLVHRARLTLRAAATAVVPLPLASWAAGATGASAPTADRVAELVAGAGASALAAKAGTVAVIATTAVATPVIVHNDKEPRTSVAAATATPQRSTPTPRPPAPTATPSPPAATPTRSARDVGRRDEPRVGARRDDARTSRPRATSTPTPSRPRGTPSPSPQGSRHAVRRAAADRGAARHDARRDRNAAPRPHSGGYREPAGRDVRPDHCRDAHVHPVRARQLRPGLGVERLRLRQLRSRIGIVRLRLRLIRPWRGKLSSTPAVPGR